MDRSVPRIGSWAGFIAVIGIMGYHIALMLVAGPRVSGTTDAAAIAAYYANDSIAVLGVTQIFILAVVAVFLVALRDTLATNRWTTWLGTIGLVAGAIELALIAVIMSTQAGVVVLAQAGQDVVGPFRVLDVLYNTAADVFEATWVLAFGLAMRHAPGFGRWMFPLSIATSVLLYLKATAIWVGVPDPVTLPVGILFAVWLIGASLGLRNLAREPVAVVQPQPA